MLAVLLGYRSEDTEAYVEIGHWIWVFTTMTNITETLYAIRDSKGKKILEELPGNDRSGLLVCDGVTSHPPIIASPRIFRGV